MRIMSFGLSMLFVMACAENPVSVSVRGATQHSVTVPLGSELRITLQTIGPGEYSTPPSISSPALRFEEVDFVSPHVPAGPTQEFRFRALAKGQAIVVFTHTGNNQTVTDTVTIQ
jgi:hypothetical protein